MCTLDNTRFSKPLWILSTSFYWRRFAWMNLNGQKKREAWSSFSMSWDFCFLNSTCLDFGEELPCYAATPCFTFRRPHFLKCLVILSASLHDIARHSTTFWHTEYHWMQMKSCLLDLAGANGDGLQTDCWASLLARFWNRQASCEICIGSRSLEIRALHTLLFTHPSVQF